ncbi:hypothetical protein [Gracilinema caldarium]|uniref:hypothetical protein n=1 Tax=Gracilinema caldarium TaxID=215591 RepID=UPI0026EB333A|nr:hypothetical protein [Gracilinema caldarium]
MKMNFDERAAYEKMKAGVLTSTGFLGSDTRPLSDIVEADEELFRALGLDFDLVAERLEALARKGAEGLGEPITIQGQYLVKSDEARGKLPCPYGDGLYHKNAVSVRKGADTVIYSDLSLHLLRVHHFCQGQGSPFRLDPVVLKRLLF